MAYLVRQRRTWYVDPAGRRVPKGTPGAVKKSDVKKHWYGVGIPGQPPKKRVPLGTTDKVAARRKLDDLVRRAERGEAGLPDAGEAKKKLLDHLSAFAADVALGLATRTGRKARVPSEAQTKLTVQRVRDLLAGCGFEFPHDLNADAPAKLARWLQGRTRLPRKEGGLSAQTAEFVLAAARRFARWISGKAPVRADLFDAVPGFDPENDRVHLRRDISPAELAQLLEATRNNTRAIRGLDGEGRYFLYLIAFSSGFRAGELAVLAPENFDLDALPPTVALPAKQTKNKRPVVQPLPPGVANQLRAFLRGRPEGHPVWRGTWSERPVSVLRRDLKAAGIPYVVPSIDGPRFADFHALRHSFVSALANAGVGPKELQELARHGDPRLTLGVYAHARPEALGAAVARLQLPGGDVRANPLKALSRDDLEALAVGLLIVNITITGSSWRIPSGTPAAGNQGDLLAPLGTGDGAKASA